MRSYKLAILALLALAGGSCTDYFQGTTLVFDFDKLDALHQIVPTDKYSAATGTGELCADDPYVEATRGQADEFGNLYQLPYQYHAWATINGSPVLLARFTVRDCTINNADFEIKPAVTTLGYTREQRYLSANAADGSRFYGAVNYVSAPIVIGSASINTEVRLDQATEIFLTREPEGTGADVGPTESSLLLMRGDLRRENQVFTATLNKVNGSATGLVTAIPADRVSAW